MQDRADLSWHSPGEMRKGLGRRIMRWAPALLPLLLATSLPVCPSLDHGRSEKRLTATKGRPLKGGRGATSETAEEFAPRSGTLAATGGSAAASAPSGPTEPGLAETGPRRGTFDQVRLSVEHSSERACNPLRTQKSLQVSCRPNVGSFAALNLEPKWQQGTELVNSKLSRDKHQLRTSQITEHNQLQNLEHGTDILVPDLPNRKLVDQFSVKFGQKSDHDC